MNKSSQDAPAPIDALVLAGRRSGETDPLASVDNVAHKALLIAGGKPLIRRVCEALRASNRVERISIAAPEDIRDAIASVIADIGNWRFVDVQGSPAKSVMSSIENIPGGRALLVTTCDHALLTPAIVCEFLDAARGGAAAAACVEKGNYQREFPNSRRTFIKLKDLSFSGANLFWFDGMRARGLADFWRRLESKRKNPAAMAREIGVFSALSYAMGLMTKEGLERTIKMRTGVDVKLAPLSDPMAAIDVDKPEDLALVREILARR
jgi:molybdopterin-guanine dinucleotide biosynthesis protein A